jgi:hypothetical protein
MTPSIHNFPLELFPLILEEACGLTAGHSDQCHSHGRQCRSVLMSAMIFSGVCRDWRQIVVDMPIFWSTVEFCSFLRPSPVEARECLIKMLRYSATRLRCICLNFSSLQGVPNGEQIIDGTLKTILKFASKTWNELCITVTDVDHFDVISDYFSSTTITQQGRLASLATLRFTHPQYSVGPSTSFPPQHSLNEYHLRNDVLPTYAFVAPLFKTLNDIHLTNVRLLSIGQRLLRIHLDNWTNVIDETFFMKSKGGCKAGLQTVRHHIVTNSAANMINCSLKPDVISSLAIVLPSVGLQSTPSTVEPFMPSDRSGHYTTSRPHIMALGNSATSLESIEFINVTAEAWLTFLAFVKPTRTGLSLPGPLQTAPLNYSWKHIVVRFAPYHKQPQAFSPFNKDTCVCLKDELHLGFDFRAKFNKVTSAKDMGALMAECLRMLTRRILPDLETFDWYDSRGWHSHLDVSMIEKLLAR